MEWIFKNYFISAVIRRWYVVLAALAGLWGILEIWERKDQEVIFRIVLSAAAGFALLLVFLGLIGVLSDLVKRIREKLIEPLCPACFVRMPVKFTCRCSPRVAVPFVTYFTRGLFYNRCRECSEKFFNKNPEQASLRGICNSCHTVIDDWRFYMFHRGEIVVTIEKSLDNLNIEPETWKTGTYHKKVPGCEHYIRKWGKRVQHWFRWAASVEPSSISQNLTENIDFIWIDNECGSGGWDKTNVILSSVRKDIREIQYGFGGKEEELRSGSLGIQGSKITCNISRDDFLAQL